MAGTESNGGATTSLLRAEGDRERPREPWKGEFVKSIVYAGLDAIVTCFSLISSISASTRSSGDVFGSAPLLSFIVLIPFTHNDTVKFVGACVLSALALALLGIAKAKIAGQNYTLSVAMTLFNGAIAAAAAYTLGSVLTEVAGLED